MSRKYTPTPYNPPKCWVGEKHKICYDSEEDAEDAARLSEYEHGLPIHSLSAYHCDMGDHWHIANKKQQ
ncbi:hypothetical protein IIZ81_03265 [Candidatus Saccharibacteria bacterium]|nr:hypothetical protein [Candidatus Saccharibacteria bacterium]